MAARDLSGSGEYYAEHEVHVHGPLRPPEKREFLRTRGHSKLGRAVENCHIQILPVGKHPKVRGQPEPWLFRIDVQCLLCVEAFLPTFAEPVIIGVPQLSHLHELTIQAELAYTTRAEGLTASDSRKFTVIVTGDDVEDTVSPESELERARRYYEQSNG